MKYWNLKLKNTKAFILAPNKKVNMYKSKKKRKYVYQTFMRKTIKL